MANADSIEQARAGSGHPSPQAGRLNVWRQLLILAGAPLAWSLQIILGYGAAAYACYPNRVPLAQPILPRLHLSLTMLSAAAIAVAALCALLAWHDWRHTRAESPGGHKHLLETGEGRTRFMALCGVISSLLFLGALLLTTSVLVLVSPCGL